jgi:excisionase family DNA binding protein
MLRSSELADRLGVSKNTVLDLANNGEIPSIRLPSGHYRFKYEDVVAALNPSPKAGE